MLAIERRTTKPLKLRRDARIRKGSPQCRRAEMVSARTGESPGVRGSAPVLRPTSIHAALPLLVSVGRPGPPAMIFDPTDGGRDLHRDGLKRVAEIAKEVRPPRRFLQPTSFAEYAPFYAAANNGTEADEIAARFDERAVK